MKSNKEISLVSTIKSTLSAAFGVQKKENLERDFQKGKPAHFIIAGLLGTILFVLSLIFLVRFILQFH